MNIETNIQGTITKGKELIHRVAAWGENVVAKLSPSESQKIIWREKAQEHEKKADFYEKRYREIMTTKPRYKPVGETTMEESDKVALDKAKGVIDKHFPDGTIDFTQMSTEQRVAKMKEVLQDAAMALDVDVNHVQWLTPKTDEQFNTGGYYIDDTNYITLNGAYVVLNDTDLHERIVSIIFHELYHARQREAYMFRKDYGYSNERLAEWYINNLPGNYIRPEVDDEAYRKQPLERDAFRFQNMVRQYINELKNKNRK